jgi:hypothetical protein
MKKLALIVILAALSTLMSAAMTSAKDEDPGKGAIKGTYEMIATGNCLHSETGFDAGPTADDPYAPYIPTPGGVTWGATTMAVGTWEFYPNGKGYAEIVNYPTDFPPGSPYIGPPPPNNTSQWGPRARATLLQYDFVYELHGDIIIITLTNHNEPYQPMGVLKGSVSIDRKTMVIPTERAKANYGPPLYWAVCSVARTFVRVSD